MSRKKSIIWLIPKTELEVIVKQSSSFTEILSKLDLKIESGGNFKTLKERLKQDNFDYQHILNNKKLFRGKIQRIPTEQLLVNGKFQSHLKERLLKENIIENKCIKCGLGDAWQNEPISLQLDHINGDSKDNRLENLRILCPNCHSQTETYAGKNSNNVKTIHYCECGNKKYKRAKCCFECKSKKQEKIIWPSNEELQELASKFSLTFIAKKLGVSDVSIAKRIKKFNLK